MASFKEFKLTSLSIDNKMSVYVLTALIFVAGIISYRNLPKENFPEIAIPTINITTVYAGTSPSDIENLVTKKIEKELKSVKDVEVIKSQSIQDFSVITVEFDPRVDVSIAKKRVEDAVDRAKAELPTDLTKEPSVAELDFSEIPVMYVNVAGNFEMDILKKYTEDLQEEIEQLPEVSKANIVGALDREIKINVDLYKMQSAQLSFFDIENKLKGENITISGGEVESDGLKRTLQLKAEFKTVEAVENIVVKQENGGKAVYLKDIATVKDGYVERQSYARLAGKNTLTMPIIKRSGGNLLEASAKIKKIVEDFKKKVPNGMEVSVVGDQSKRTKALINDLINGIIIGLILVTVVLLFFMGTQDALFVGLSVPISMLMTFIILPWLNFNLNLMVLFSLILALGLVVDDAIVVIENTFRFHKQGDPIVIAAKKAAGQIAVPVIAGTATTLAAFVPLAFWSGIIGEFMRYLPITLIIVLGSSLFVSLVINPVLAVDFMKLEDHTHKKPVKPLLLTTAGFLLVGIIGYAAGSLLIGNIFTLIAILLPLNRFVLTPASLGFQHFIDKKFLPQYKKGIAFILKGKRALFLFPALILLIMLVGIGSSRLKPPIFFPQSDPNNIFIYTSLPIGTSISVTDSVTRELERRVDMVLGKNNPVVESIVSNVGAGAGDPQQPDVTLTPHKSRISIGFIEYEKRNGASTQKYLEQIREVVKGIPGTIITVDKENNGPPVGKPINIEVAGDDYVALLRESARIKKYLDSLRIEGVEELKLDVQNNKPEILIEVDRQKAGVLGVSPAQIGLALRTSIFGKEISKYRDIEDEYPIVLRLDNPYRYDLDVLRNMKVTFRDNMGQLHQVPISTVADIKYSFTYNSIVRKDLKRMITIYSNVLTGYNPNEVVQLVQAALNDYKPNYNCSVKMTGEQEKQKETMGFLVTALLSAVFLIFFIMVLEFNSVSTPLIVMFTITLSFIGVFLGYIIFGGTISIVMSGVGIVSLAGIVVKNGIVLLDYTRELIRGGTDVREALAEASATRFKPVILTALCAILGLVPLGIGLNIDFVGLFTELKPDIFFGGDNANFWGPMAWTIIYGLSFATILTLAVVPMMYLLVYKFKHRVGVKRV